VQEAAEVLGTSVDAVRMRARRGSLEAEKEPDGRVYVWVDGDSSETKPRLDVESGALISAKDEIIEELRDRARYLERLLDQEREARTEERRRHDTLLAQLMTRIPELEAPNSPREWLEDEELERDGRKLSTRPDRVRQRTHDQRHGVPQEARDAPEMPTVEPVREDPHPATEGAQEGSEHRSSWWRRWFGFE
jgi:hypothetical protein